MFHLKPDDRSNFDDDYILETQDDEGETEERAEENYQARHSSRLAGKSPPLIKTKILDALYSRNISAPLGVRHDELFQFFVANPVQDQAAVPPLTSSSRKSSSKKNHCRPAAANDNNTANTAAKRPRLQTHADHQDEDPVLAALSNIQSSLSVMEVRLQVLESRSDSQLPTLTLQPSTSTTTSTAFGALLGDVMSHRTLGTAVPTAPTGVPFFPPAAAVSPQLKNQILAVHKLVSHLRQGCFGSYADALLESVFFTAFYGCGECTTSSDSFDPLNDLTISDITVDSDMYSIHIKHSKTDREGKGSTVFISQTNTAFCPVSSMNLYLQRRPCVRQDQPLFLTGKGKAMSRSWFTTRLRFLCQRCGLPPQLYTSHSFRIAAATSAAALVPISTLKAMGRWSSSAYERYIRPGVNEIISAQKAMSANT
ncbi:hypothetical protein F2P81_013214 [Scophthalmus maximus]|uniref:Tyr recombinase domain-containing protein n=1 Tax=Scophthalmus maximus TaxID=52904 RepID=A0A6A4SJQ7_SCOMX|nr:hypothetical protein F2P81_013214 [Scophthalmus maximus]